MVSRLLYLEAGQLRRAWPFFALYVVLFAALTLADGLSLSLVVQTIGPSRLPHYYAASSLCVLASIGAYMLWGDRREAGWLFLVILAVPLVLFAATWVALATQGPAVGWLGCLFVARELAFALVLLHFGAYLQEYFTRTELLRVMPVVYAGGRVGGIVGGLVLEHACGLVEPLDLLPVVAGLLAAGMLGVLLVGRFCQPVPELDTPSAAPAEASAEGVSWHCFARLLASHRLLFWISVSTVAYFACRTFLNFRCGEFFAGAFATETEMARYLGRYTQWALGGSLLLQLLLINRWISWVGLGGAHLTYAALLVAAAALGSFELTLASATFVRLVEGELRYSLRNPAAQLTVNRFARPIRLRVRSWSLGVLIPGATFAASAGLAWLVNGAWTPAAAAITGLLGVAYLLATIGLARQLDEPSAVAVETPVASGALSARPALSQG